MTRKIGIRDVRGLKPGMTIWDGAVKGFGARRQVSDAVFFVLKYRTKDGRQRWHTIGQFGSPWTPEEARSEAKRLLGEVSTGGDPSGDRIARREAMTVAELCDLYYADAIAGRVRTRAREAKKPSTLAIDRGRIERHIKPLVGGLGVGALTRDDIERLLHDVAGGRTAGRTKTKTRGLARVKGGETAANRVVGLFGAIFSYAIRKKLRADNPCRGVQLFADKKRERRLSVEEYAKFGAALREADKAIWPLAVAAARFIALSGWRRGEVLGLRWSEINLANKTATLAETKTGRSVRPLSHAACDVLRALPIIGDLVFPASRGNYSMSGFPKIWARIAKLGPLPSDVTPHVLRHSFASLAADLGYSEPTIAALVGHQGRTTTSRYLHAADSVLLAAANVVADRTADLMGEARSPGVVIELSKRAMNAL
jgi:integrase